MVREIIAVTSQKLQQLEVNKKVFLGGFCFRQYANFNKLFEVDGSRLPLGNARYVDTSILYVDKIR
jgi:hypothetical protein